MIEALYAAAAATSIESILLNLGLPGVIIIALGLYARGAIKDGEDRNRRLEDDNRRLYQLMAEQMIPALTKANDTMIDATAVIADIKRREEQQAAVEEARRLLREGEKP